MLNNILIVLNISVLQSIRVPGNFTWEHSQKPENKVKNRYANIIPCEQMIVGPPMKVIWILSEKTHFHLVKKQLGTKCTFAFTSYVCTSSQTLLGLVLTGDFDVSDSLRGICLMGNICKFFSCKINECKDTVIECKIPLIVALLWRYVTKWQVF